MAKRRVPSRKLLVASSGVMTVSYLAAGCTDKGDTYGTSGNLAPPPASEYPVAPPASSTMNATPSGTPSTTGPNPSTTVPGFTACVANLPAPPVPDLTPTVPATIDVPAPSVTSVSTDGDAGIDAGMVAAGGASSDAGLAEADASTGGDVGAGAGQGSGGNR
jgi:hypothetical protein